jgi:hypothetical protein
MSPVIEESVAPKFVKHSLAAKIHGVHIATLDRWIATGVIPKPIRINRQKYHSVETLAAVGTRRGYAR